MLDEVPFDVLESRYADSDVSGSEGAEVATTAGARYPVTQAALDNVDDYDSDFEYDRVVHKMNAALKQGGESKASKDFSV